MATFWDLQAHVKCFENPEFVYLSVFFSLYILCIKGQQLFSSARSILRFCRNECCQITTIFIRDFSWVLGIASYPLFSQLRSCTCTWMGLYIRAQKEDKKKHGLCCIYSKAFNTILKVTGWLLMLRPLCLKYYGNSLSAFHYFIGSQERSFFEFRVECV